MWKKSSRSIQKRFSLLRVSQAAIFRHAHGRFCRVLQRVLHAMRGGGTAFEDGHMRLEHLREIRVHFVVMPGQPDEFPFVRCVITRLGLTENDERIAGVRRLSYEPTRPQPQKYEGGRHGRW